MQPKHSKTFLNYDISTTPLLFKSNNLNAFLIAFPSSSLVKVFYLIFSNKMISKSANLSGDT